MQWARKLGVSQPTMARIERGDPSVAMASYVMCMWLINQACGLADLVAPQNDHASLEREVSKARARGVSVAPAPASVPTPQAEVRSTATHNAKAAAGLAALLSQAEPKPQ